MSLEASDHFWGDVTSTIAFITKAGGEVAKALFNLCLDILVQTGRVIVVYVCVNDDGKTLQATGLLFLSTK